MRSVWLSVSSVLVAASVTENWEVWASSFDVSRYPPFQVFAGVMPHAPLTADWYPLKSGPGNLAVIPIWKWVGETSIADALNGVLAVIAVARLPTPPKGVVA